MESLLQNIYVVNTLESVALLFAVIFLSKIAVSVVGKKERRNSEATYIIKYAAIIIFTLGLVFIWLGSIGPVLTALTIVAAALTIVSKELILNFLGSFVIFWRELFAIGDRIQVGEHTGDVIDKGLLFFTLLEAGQRTSTGHSTGRLVKIPNGLVMTMPVINATRGAGYVWNEVRISVTRSSDWEKVKELLLKLAADYITMHSMDLEKVKASFERRKVYFNKLTPKVYVSIGNGAVNLTLRYVCSSRLVRESEDFIFSELLKRMDSDVAELSDVQNA